MLSIDAVDVARGPCTIVEGVTATVAAGERLALIGPNGVGKSTLLHTLIGDHAPAAGRITLDGVAIDALADRERARRVALLAQANTLGFPFTVAEVIGLGRAPHASGAVADREIVAAAAAVADVADFMARRYTRLSGGEKQRVQLARVLAQIWRAEDAGSRLLLLDEPVAALDLGHQSWVMARLAEFATTGVAVVMVLHDVTLAARHADRMLALGPGRVVAHGTPAEVVTAETMRAVFGIESRVMAHPATGTPVVLHA